MGRSAIDDQLRPGESAPIQRKAAPGGPPPAVSNGRGGNTTRAEFSRRTRLDRRPVAYWSTLKADRAVTFSPSPSLMERGLGGEANQLHATPQALSQDTLDQFQVATAVPVGDGLIVFFYFPTPGCNKMLHKIGSQVFPGKLAALQHICCSREIARERPDMAFLKRSGNRCFIVGNSIEALAQFQFVLDTIETDRKSTRLNSSHTVISYAVFCLKKKKKKKECV